MCHPLLMPSTSQGCDQQSFGPFDDRGIQRPEHANEANQFLQNFSHVHRVTGAGFGRLWHGSTAIGHGIVKDVMPNASPFR